MKPQIKAQPRQQLLLSCPANEVLYGGARGGGKSFATLLDWLAHRLRYGADAKGILFRKSMPELEDMLSKAQKLFPQTGGKYFVQPKTWVWPDGSSLKFRYLERPSDAALYQGHEFTFIAFEEVGTYDSPEPIDLLRACFRSTGNVKHRLVLTANPGGSGHNWLKAKYIDPVPPMKINQIRPGWSVCYIPAKVTDNPALLNADPDYINRIKDAATNPQLLKAWLDGSWDIVAGGMFDDVWNPNQHILQPFKVPESWRIDRAFDWGSSKPFAVGWFAESDGSVVYLNGQPKYFPPKSVIMVGELYGWNGKPNQGCRMLASEVAREIIRAEKQFGFHQRVKPGPADSAIYTRENGNCIADDMLRAGVKWERADKSPGSRIHGWETMRRMLHAANQHMPEEPGFWVFESCTHTIRTLPVAPRDERKMDDIDSDYEDHLADCLRYRLTSKSRIAKSRELFL